VDKIDYRHSLAGRCWRAFELDVNGQVLEAGHQLAGLEAIALDGDLAGSHKPFRLPQLVPFIIPPKRLKHALDDSIPVRVFPFQVLLLIAISAKPIT